MVISLQNKRTDESPQEYEWAGGGALLGHRSGDCMTNSNLDVGMAELSPARWYAAPGEGAEASGCTKKQCAWPEYPAYSQENQEPVNAR